MKFTLIVEYHSKINENDPIRLLEANIAPQKIVSMSHQVGEPIGKRFTVTMNSPCVQPTMIQDYLKNLEKEGKKLDSFLLGNSHRSFFFQAFLTGVGTTYEYQAKNMGWGYMESSKGFMIWDQ